MIYTYESRYTGECRRVEAPGIECEPCGFRPLDGEAKRSAAGPNKRQTEHLITEDRGVPGAPCKIIIKLGNSNLKLILLKLTILPISTRQSIFKIKTVGTFSRSRILIGSLLLTA